MGKLKKSTRIKREKEKLLKNCEKFNEAGKNLFAGHIDQQAFLKIELEDIREKLDKEGWVEDFRNSPNLPEISREKALAKQYNNLSKIYDTYVKRLDDKIIDVERKQKEKEQGKDDFDSFLDER